MRTGTVILITAGAAVAAIAAALQATQSDLEVVQTKDSVPALNTMESMDYLLREAAETFQFDDSALLQLEDSDPDCDQSPPTTAQPQTLMELLEIEHSTEYKQGCV